MAVNARNERENALDDTQLCEPACETEPDSAPETVVQTAADSAGPEPGANGQADVSGAVREALEDLAQRPLRDPETGRYVAGTLAAGKTLRRSEQFWSAVEPAKRELRARI